MSQNLDLKNFVNINIKPKYVPVISSGMRPTLGILTDVARSAYTADPKYYDDINKVSIDYKNEMLTALVQTFFSNGGKKVYIIGGAELGSDNAISIQVRDFPEDVIMFTVLWTEDDGNMSTMMNSFSAYCDTDVGSGINEKLFIYRNMLDWTTHNDLNNYPMTRNVAIKAFSSGEDGTHSDDYQDCLMAGYLAQIDTYKQNSVKDYCYTVEPSANSLSDIPTGASIDTNAVYKDIVVDKHQNADFTLVGKTVNLGGTCTDGQSLVNTYVRIILTQNLTNALVDLLTQKLSDLSGVSKIYSTITSELDRYVPSGYLTTDKVWTDDDLVVSYGGQQYTVIEKGTPLTKGYYVKVLPMSSLTEADKAAHKAPPIYVILAESYAIKTIAINGEVI